MDVPRPGADGVPVAMITGMTDALSDDQSVHMRSIEAIKAIISGELIGPPRADRRRRVG